MHFAAFCMSYMPGVREQFPAPIILFVVGTPDLRSIPMQHKTGLVGPCFIGTLYTCRAVLARHGRLPTSSPHWYPHQAADWPNAFHRRPKSPLCMPTGLGLNTLKTPHQQDTDLLHEPPLGAAPWRISHPLWKPFRQVQGARSIGFFTQN